MRVWALRHGQSEYNLLALCNDDPARKVALTDEGRRQAQRAARVLAAADLDAAFASPLPRALQTAAIVLGGRTVPLVVDPRLADIRSGFDGRPVAEYFAAIDHDPLHARAQGGESLLDHRERVTGFLEWLRGQDYREVLLVAHEETLRVVKAFAEGLDSAEVIGLGFANGEPFVFEI